MQDFSTLPIGARVAVLWNVGPRDEQRVELAYGSVSKRHKDNTLVVQTDDGEAIRFLSYGSEYGRNSRRRAYPVTEENREWWARTVEYVNDEYRPREWYRPDADTVIGMIEKMEKERAVARFWKWFSPVWDSREVIGDYGAVRIDRVTISGEFTHSGQRTQIFFVRAKIDGDLSIYAIHPRDRSAQSGYTETFGDGRLPPEIFYDCLRGFPLHLDKE
jgi:hypothetical protein